MARRKNEVVEVVEEVKPLQKKPPVREGNTEDTLHAMDIMALTPLKLTICQAAEVELRSQEYLELCITNNKKPGMAGYALALGVSRGQLVRYITGEVAIPKDVREVLVRFSALLDSLMEDYMMNGKINPVSGIWLQKNNFGYKEQIEYVINNQVSDDATPEALEQEAALLLAESKKANIEE